MMNLSLTEIRIDGGTQSRGSLSEATVQEYAQAMTDGIRFPPIVVFHDGSVHWLADGFHRFMAAKSAGLADIDADIRAGTRRDAVLYSVGSNAEHGLPRTNADKRHAVTMLLRDEEWSRWSDREIARRCCVGYMLVAKVREELSLPVAGSDTPRTYTTKHGTEATMRTQNIGRGRDGAAVDDAAVLVPPSIIVEMPKSRGVALAYSAKAIEYLGMIPPNDGLRHEALAEVSAWIEYNR